MHQGNSPSHPDAGRQGSHFYIEFSETQQPDQIRNALKAAGMATSDCRAVTPNTDGYIITQVLIAGIWNHETGEARCKDQCPKSGPTHTPWHDLTPEQQDIFRERYVEFLESCRQQELSPCTLLEDLDQFLSVALFPH